MHFTSEPHEHEHVLWERDRLEFVSVGIDIGTATSQVLFTRNELRRLGSALSSRFVIVKQEVLHQSPIRFTPYCENGDIDAEEVSAFVGSCFASVGLQPSEVESGVVLLTGQALLRNNAQAIARGLAARSGNFICHAAGHKLEAQIAAHGSGAVTFSRQNDQSVLNIDIGGGTTKLSVISDGEITGSAALEVGSRALVFDSGERITSITDGARLIAERRGIDCELGSLISGEARMFIASDLIAEVWRTIEGSDPSTFLLTEPLPKCRIDLVVCSGGVAEYLNSTADGHGDLGAFLASCLKAVLNEQRMSYRVARNPIRATVIGSAQHTVQLSGNTLFMSEDAPVARPEVPVIRFQQGAGPLSREERLRSQQDQFAERAEVIVEAGSVAVAIDWEHYPSGEELRQVLSDLLHLVANVLPQEIALVILTNQDVALVAGKILRHEMALSRTLLCIDGVTFDHELAIDYVDLGKFDQKTGTIKVTLKSILYPRATLKSVG